MADAGGVIAAVAPGDRPQQLWLDVARPIQPRPPRERRALVRRQSEQVASQQMELRMVTPPLVPAMPLRESGAGARADAPLSPVRDVPAREERACFVTWLSRQGKSKDAIGELAKAARTDPLFPRKGSAEEVRARFGKAGADGDAYAALEDAERAYDRAEEELSAECGDYV